MEINDGLSKLIEERMEELYELQCEFDKGSRAMIPDLKTQWLEELTVKTQLLLTLLMKAQRNLTSQLDDVGSYMYRSDIERAIKETKEYINNFKAQAYALAEVLRVERLKLENIFELQKLDMERKEK